MEFTGLNENRQPTLELPSVAMKFNGIYLEEHLDGYRTLNVSGREMMNYDIQSDRRTSGDGSIRYGKNRPSRIISVQYRLVSDTPEQMQRKYNELRRLLHTEGIVPIEFLDEPNTVYFGEFQSAEGVPDDRLTVVSRFTLFCPESDKYGQLITTNGAVTINTFYKTLPEKITVTTTSTTNSVDISNGTQTIQLRGELNSGSVIKVDIKEQMVYVNGNERLDLIDLHSDFENFELKNGQTVTTSNGAIEIEMREVV